jgi:hypothetical protein
MAEIAVERKRGFPWWAWLLAIVGVVLLLWLAFGRDRGVGEAERAAGEPIRDVSVFHGGMDPDSLVGSRVEIENARVMSVTGDRDFWVADGQGGQVLVILDQVMTPEQPRIEGRYDVNPGQTISIYGTVQRAPSWDEAQSRWNLNPQVQSNFENQRVYIQAERLDISEWNEQREPVETSPVAPTTPMTPPTP